MNVVWGVVVLALSMLAWGGQALSWLVPRLAVRWKLMEAEDDVEPTFWADARAEALWDTLTLWTMAAAGALLIADVDAWAYFGLVGGGMYLYFGGRGILARAALARRGLRIGLPQSVRVGVSFLAVWAVMALVTIVAAIVSIEG